MSGCRAKKAPAMAATPQGNYTGPVVIDPITRIEGHLKIEVEVDNGFSDFRDNQMLVTVGGQAEVSEDWFLGGSLAYQYDDLKSDNGTVRGTSDTALAAVTLKRVWDNWTFSGAITASAGWGQTTVRISGWPGQVV